MKLAEKHSEGPTQAERVREQSRRRREEQKDSLRRAILEAAGSLFLEHGYEGFSMRQVAERIGYSATTIYRYFENKDDLLFAVLLEGFVEFRRRLREAAESSDVPGERLRALGRAYTKFGLENPVYYQLMFMQRSDFLFESRRDQTEPMIDSFNVLQEAVGEAMRSGAIQEGDVETYSHVIWALVHGITSLAVADPKRFTPDAVERSTRLAMTMVAEGLHRR